MLKIRACSNVSLRAVRFARCRADRDGNGDGDGGAPPNSYSPTSAMSFCFLVRAGPVEVGFVTDAAALRERVCAFCADSANRNRRIARDFLHTGHSWAVEFALVLKDHAAELDVIMKNLIEQQR